MHNVAGLQLHGTGTTLGDPIELGAAAGEFPSHRKHELPCVLLLNGWCCSFLFC